MLWYNNVKRHIANWQWRKQLGREPEIEEEWYAEGHTLSLRSFSGGKLDMAAVEYGQKVIERMEDQQ